MSPTRGVEMAEEFIDPYDTGSSSDSIPHSGKRRKITHILIGEAEVVRRTIDKLHVIDYAERHQWSKLQPPGNLGNPPEVISVLVRYPIFE
jgi:hypothetical protein